MAVYEQIGCTKTDISRWRYNPCSTHAASQKAKYIVIRKAAKVFEMTEEEEEALANKAGLSMVSEDRKLKEIVQGYHGKRCDLLAAAGVSERMFQYYLRGKTPAKQALLSILIVLDLPCKKIDNVLRTYGYCLSRSLPNDVVVLWFLEHRKEERAASLLISINMVLDTMELPLLMTKIRNC